MTPRLTPHEAVLQRRLDLLHDLYNAGIDVDAISPAYLNCTPLHLAAIFGELDIVRFLLSVNAEVNARTADGRTPLIAALQNEQTVVVNILLAYGPTDINARESLDGTTALHIACRIGDRDTIAQLVTRGADVNARDTDGFTPLHYAAINGNCDIINHLLANGSNPNAKTNEEEDLPYELAQQNDNDAAHKILFPAAILKPQKKDHKNYTPDWSSKLTSTAKSVFSTPDPAVRRREFKLD